MPQNPDTRLRKATRKRADSDAEWKAAIKAAAEADYSQREIAKLAGVSQPRIAKILKTLAVMLVALAAMGGEAQAQEPFLPGQVKSQALADSIWHPPCAHVGVTSEAWDGRTAPWLGMAAPDTCRVALNAKDIEREARDVSNGGERIVVLSHGKVRLGHRASVRWYRREVAIWTCTVLVHEYGHLARFYDPVGYQGETGATLVGDPLDAGVALPDHSHSDDPHNVMYPFMENTYAPCRALFPKTAISSRTTP